MKTADKNYSYKIPSIYNWEETGGEGKLLKSFCLSVSDLAWLVSKIFFAKYLHRKKYIYRITNSCCKIPNLNYLKKNKLFKSPEEKLLPIQQFN